MLPLWQLFCLLWLLVLVASTSSVFAATPCLYYCGSGDTLSDTTCTETSSPCRLGFSVKGGYCYGDACTGTNAVIGSRYDESCTKQNSGRTDTDLNTGCTNSMTTCTTCRCCYCYTGSRTLPSSGAHTYVCTSGLFTITPSGEHWCYTGANARSPIPACPSGSQYYTNNNECRDSVGPTCPTGSSLKANNMCVRTYNASVVTTSAQCSVSPSTATLCDWCTGIRICMPNNNCVPTCYDVSEQATCNRQGSACHWCTDIGVCLPNAISGCPYGTCLGATANPTACSASADCKWCAAGTSIGVCQPNAGTCYTTCLNASIATEAPVCNGSQLCSWCAAPLALPYCRRNTEACQTVCTDVAQYDPAICQVPSMAGTCMWCAALQYCVSTADVPQLRCASHCEAMIWRRDVCGGALACHWCPQHGGRCKPVAGETQGYVNWRGESECDTGSGTASSTVAISRSHSSSDAWTASDSVSTTQTVTTTAASSSDEMTLTASMVNVSVSVTAVATMSCSTTSSLTWNSSTSPSQSPTPSLSSTRGTASRTALLSDSQPLSVTETASVATGSVSTVSPTLSFYLPPCSASHAETLRRVWPTLFNFTTIYMDVILNGFPSVEITGGVHPALIYQVPHLLRAEVLSGARPVLMTPLPYEPPNERGFVHRGETAIALSWVNRTTLRVSMNAIPDYWIDISEDITIDVPFDEIVLCNRTANGSVPLAPTLRLVQVRIVGPPVNDAVSPAVQALTSVFVAASLFAGDASSASALQTLAVISMTPCGQPSGKNTLSNTFILGPLPVGVDGFAGVLLGNTVLVFSFTLGQLVAARIIMRVRRLVFVNACAVVRAPSLTCAGTFALFQGTFFAASQLAARPDSSDAERGWGIVVFAVCAVLLPVLVWYCWRFVVRQCVLYRYERSPQFAAMYKGMLQRILLPLGRIEPPHVRHRFSSLVGSYVLDRLELPVLSVMVPYFVTWLTLWQPADSYQCSWFLSVALCIHVAVAAWVLYWRPHRFVYASPLFAVGVLLNGVFLLFSILSLSYPQTLTRNLVTFCVVLQLVLQLTRVLLLLSSQRLEETLEFVPTEVSWASGVLSSTKDSITAVSDLEELLRISDSLLDNVPLTDAALFTEVQQEPVIGLDEEEARHAEWYNPTPEAEGKQQHPCIAHHGETDESESDDSSDLFHRTTASIMNAVSTLFQKLGLQEEQGTKHKKLGQSEEEEMSPCALQPTDKANLNFLLHSDPQAAEVSDLSRALLGLGVIDERKALEEKLRINT